MQVILKSSIYTYIQTEEVSGNRTCFLGEICILGFLLLYNNGRSSDEGGVVTRDIRSRPTRFVRNPNLNCVGCARSCVRLLSLRITGLPLYQPFKKRKEVLFKSDKTIATHTTYIHPQQYYLSPTLPSASEQFSHRPLPPG